MDKFFKSNELTIENSRKNDEAKTTESFQESMKYFDSMQINLDALVLLNRNGAHKASDDSKAEVDSGRLIILVGIILAGLIGSVLSYLLIRIISKPLADVTKSINEVANGNLKIEDIIVKNHDEIGTLANAVNTMKSQLSSMISNMLSVSQNVKQQSEELTQSSNELKIGTEQVASAMQQLAAAAEEQATSSTETATTVENFNKQIIETNQSGETLKQKSEMVYDKSAQGKKLMDQSVEQMEKVHTLMETFHGKSHGIGSKQSKY